MLLSPLAEGLFSRAISQSGSARMTLRSDAENDVDDPVSPGASFSSGELLLWLLVEDGQATDRASARTLRDGMSPSEIGEYFGDRAHNTVISAQQRVSGWIDNDSWVSHPHGQCRVSEALRRCEAQFGT